jgi:hypothetical protein
MYGVIESHQIDVSIYSTNLEMWLVHVPLTLCAPGNHAFYS